MSEQPRLFGEVALEKGYVSVADLYEALTIQARLDAQTAYDQMTAVVDMEALEEGFVRNAASYSQRKGITWSAWREVGVPASVLAAAGIKRTRKA